MTGRRRLGGSGNAVAPVSDKEQSPSHKSVTTSKRRQSNAMSAAHNTSGQLLNQPVGYGSNQPPHHLQPAHHGGDPPQSLAYDHLPPQVYY